MAKVFKGFISSIDSDGFRVCIPQLDNFVTQPLKKLVSDELVSGDKVEAIFYDAELGSGYITAKLPV